MKTYKAVDPIITVAKVKNILSDIGILTMEEYIDNVEFFSCRINIGNTSLRPLRIGTNGKGRSFEYSLASGYAEFMERLQNNMLLFGKRFATKLYVEKGNLPQSYINKLQKDELIFDYYYDKDESTVDIDYIIERCGNELMKIYNFHTIEELRNYLEKEFDKHDCLLVPFYSVFDKKVMQLPIEMLLMATGSNGMASGNTPKEAILQGLCEIFERYAISTIHNNELTPPTIPFDSFRGKPVYEKLTYLKRNTNYKIIIKDCSLGIGLPVIGVIIIDTEKQRYNFKLASDFIPEIALERCLTEIYQGVKEFKSVPFKLLSLKEISELHKENSIFLNLERIFVNGSGFWPLSIFGEDFSYEFKGLRNDLGESNEADLNFAMSLIKKLGFNVYIRDNSVLGFPTYYIVVPGMSQIVENNRCGAYDSSYSKLLLIRELGDINKEKAKELAEAIDKNYGLIKFRELDYTKHYIFNTDSDLKDLDIELLAFMLFYYLHDFEKALYYLGIFIKDKDPEIFGYYFSVYDFVDLKWRKNLDPVFIKEVLDKKYSEEQSRELFEDFSDPEIVFQYYNFPNGFNIDASNIDKFNGFFSALKIEKQIEKQAREKNIEQSNLEKEFEQLVIE